ncbi:MAG: site-specific integrase [Patescibacteria group bacterium]
MNVIHILLQNFSQFLQDTGASSNTIKNYIADINVFFRFVSGKQQPISFLTIDSLLSTSSQDSYHQYLTANFPIATVKRRLSSLNKFAGFVKNSHLISTTPVVPTPNFQSPISIPLPIPSPLPPLPDSKSNFPFLFAIFVLLTVSASIMGGYLVSRISAQSIVGLVDPSVTNLSYP